MIKIFITLGFIFLTASFFILIDYLVCKLEFKKSLLDKIKHPSTSKTEDTQ